MPTTGFHYILRDAATGQHHYTGVAQNLHERLSRHNSGQVPHTAKYAPWHIETAIAFRDKQKAYAFTSATSKQALVELTPRGTSNPAALGGMSLTRHKAIPCAAFLLTSGDAHGTIVS